MLQFFSLRNGDGADLGSMEWIGIWVHISVFVIFIFILLLALLHPKLWTLFPNLTFFLIDCVFLFDFSPFQTKRIFFIFVANTPPILFTVWNSVCNCNVSSYAKVISVYVMLLLLISLLLNSLVSFWVFQVELSYNL